MKILKNLLFFCVAALFFSCQHTPQRPVEMSDRQILGLTDKVQQVTLISQHIDEEKRDTTFLTFDPKGRMTEKIEHLQKIAYSKLSMCMTMPNTPDSPKPTKAMERS